ncbi:AraC family transcriptional regulator [Pontibacter amylolyticus]|uniref:AraC family transcriptional regulator n=1 Tax=Pontibacter amylolyticus TaxID=1424080 RepID=A0ABQ1WEX8_9BACT|nr:helix-turn-helix domain-containing protein [Pontibacter amylolyticus]GGG27881.1 AraC family transcriptional regulator [Pontibacter amylolyticus]
MRKEHLPIYQIQDFEALANKDRYFYFSSFAAHLKEHQFIREPHKHDFYIILLVTQGTGVHTIDFREYAVEPGTVFLLTPGQVHSWTLSNDADGFVVFFTQAYYTREYPDRLLSDFPYFNALLYSPVIRLTETDEAKLTPVLHMLQQEYEVDSPMRNSILSRYLDILLMKLAQIFQPDGSATVPIAKEQTLLQDLERLINLHYKEQKTVSFYAGRLHVTAKHLNETCKQALGKTTKDILQYRIILEAQRLLVHSDLTSSQIAHELGYFDNTYFFRFFKKHIGCTPEQFRAANR